MAERESAPEDYLAGTTADERRAAMPPLPDRGPFPCVYVQHVYLAADEWGNRLMEMVARDALVEALTDPARPAANLRDHPVIVYVHEHAGWWLAYTMLDGVMVVVATANDRAEFAPGIHEFRRRAFNAPRDFLPEVRR